MANADLLAVVLERLEPLPVATRSMFGSRGLYLEDKFFGIITDGKVYFRTDEESRSDYRERGMTALQPPKHRPRGPKTVDCNFEVPPEVLANQALLKEWAIRASQAKR